jgi:hypothetical protein
MNIHLLPWPIRPSACSFEIAYALDGPAKPREQQILGRTDCSPRLALTWVFRPERLAKWTLLSDAAD